MSCKKIGEYVRQHVNGQVKICLFRQISSLSSRSFCMCFISLVSTSLSINCTTYDAFVLFVEGKAATTPTKKVVKKVVKKKVVPKKEEPEEKEQAPGK